MSERRCGTCRWWDMNDAPADRPDWPRLCKAPLPHCFYADDGGDVVRDRMLPHEGTTCPAWQERGAEGRDE